MWPQKLRASLNCLTLSMFAGVAFSCAVSAEEIITSHAITVFPTDEPIYPADFKHYNFVNPDAPKGGQISISAVGTFDSLNPYATLKGTPGRLSSVMYESILEATADDISARYCLLCTTMEYPESQDWVIFNLRPEVRFSDGTPLTAHDVVFSHNLAMDQATPSLASYLKVAIPTVEALDDYRVKFTFGKGIPRKSLITQAGFTPIWSKDWFERTGARLDESRMETSPGSSPYMLGSYDTGKSITYQRNPDYWGKDLPNMQGRSNFDTIRVEYFGDANAAFIGFTAGEFTFRRENSSLNWATAYDFPALEKGWVIKDEPENSNVPQASGYVFNLRREKFQDRRVRMALGLMYNFTFTNETLQFGLFKQRESFWQNSPLQAKGMAEGRELELLQSVADKIDPILFEEPVFLPHESAKRQTDRGNLRKALALMAEAGYTPGDDGLLRNENGQTLEVEILETRQDFDRLATPYIENLKRLGVEATYTRVDAAQYQQRTQSFDYDIIYDSYRTGPIEGTGMEQRFGSEDRQDVFNPAGFGHPAVDFLIKKVIDAQSYNEMAAAVRAADRIMRYEYFVIPTGYIGEYWVAYYDMYDHPEELPPYDLGYLDFWWYDAEKAAKLRADGALR